MVPFFSPLGYISANAGPEGGEEPSGKDVLRLIQIRLTTPNLKKSPQPVKPIRLFICAHNEVLFAAPIRVNNPDCSSAKQRNVDGK